MYYYIFDIKKFKKSAQVENIKNYLSILGISGEFTYPTPAQTVEELVDLGLSKQFSTIVAIGGDEIANAVAGKLIGRKEAMGIIPLEISPALTKLIGTEGWKEACDSLRYRKLSELRLGRTATGKCFLTSVHLQIKNPIEVTLEFKDYIVQTKATSLSIANYDPNIKKIGDDFLDIQISSADVNESALSRFSSLLGIKKRDNLLSYSLLRARSLRIFTKSQLSLISGNALVAKSPQLIESTDEYLRLITAKGASIPKE